MPWTSRRSFGSAIGAAPSPARRRPGNHSGTTGCRSRRTLRCWPRTSADAGCCCRRSSENQHDAALADASTRVFNSLRMLPRRHCVDDLCDLAPQAAAGAAAGPRRRAELFGDDVIRGRDLVGSRRPRRVTLRGSDEDAATAVLQEFRSLIPIFEKPQQAASYADERRSGALSLLRAPRRHLERHIRARREGRVGVITPQLTTPISLRGRRVRYPPAWQARCWPSLWLPAVPCHGFARSASGRGVADASRRCRCPPMPRVSCPVFSPACFLPRIAHHRGGHRRSRRARRTHPCLGQVKASAPQGMNSGQRPARRAPVEHVYRAFRSGIGEEKAANTPRTGAAGERAISPRSRSTTISPIEELAKISVEGPEHYLDPDWEYWCRHCATARRRAIIGHVGDRTGGDLSQPLQRFSAHRKTTPHQRIRDEWMVPGDSWHELSGRRAAEQFLAMKKERPTVIFHGQPARWRSWPDPRGYPGSEGRVPHRDIR